MKNALTAAFFILLTPCLAFAEAQTGQSPKASPEIQKLGYYVGTWNGHGETKGGPFGAAGKLSSKQTCKWFTGGFQVICQGEEAGPTGTRGFLNILSYDPKSKHYAEYAVSSLGDIEYDQGGTLDGNRLVFLIKQSDGGKSVEIRYTETHVTPGLYSYRAEVAQTGAPWVSIAEGSITKVR